MSHLHCLYSRRRLRTVWFGSPASGHLTSASTTFSAAGHMSSTFAPTQLAARGSSTICLEAAEWAITPGCGSWKMRCAIPRRRMQQRAARSIQTAAARSVNVIEPFTGTLWARSKCEMSFRYTRTLCYSGISLHWTGLVTNSVIIRT